jgi:DNA-binding transcriptional ArsR family regulator
MKAKPLSSLRRVSDSRQAAAFSDPLRRRLILSLSFREGSVTDMARALELDIKRVHYHVTALVEIGLLHVAREERRAGRAVKKYRAVASSFFVPDGLAPRSPGDLLVEELRRSLAGQRRLDGTGMLYDANAQGHPRMRPARRGGARPSAVSEHWRVLRLFPADAQRLARELADCVQAYEARPARGGAEYLVHMAVARRRSHGGVPQ